MAIIVVRKNSGNLAAINFRRAKALSEEIVAAEKANIERAKAIAIKYSSGTAFKIGRDKGHPYALRSKKGSGGPPGPPEVVNLQSGKLRSSWETEVKTTPDGVQSDLSNPMPYAKFFNGKPTRVMIGRPILQAVMREVRDVRRRELQEAANRALEQGDGRAYRLRARP